MKTSWNFICFLRWSKHKLKVKKIGHKTNLVWREIRNKEKSCQALVDFRGLFHVQVFELNFRSKIKERISLWKKNEESVKTMLVKCFQLRFYKKSCEKRTEESVKTMTRLLTWIKFSSQGCSHLWGSNLKSGNLFKFKFWPLVVTRNWALHFL